MRNPTWFLPIGYQGKEHGVTSVELSLHTLIGNLLGVHYIPGDTPGYDT